MQFFQTCQKEKEDVFKEALYKKARYLARIGKASICTDIKSYAEDVLKRIVQQTGSVFKEVNPVFSCTRADIRHAKNCLSYKAQVYIYSKTTDQNFMKSVHYGI